MATTSPGEISLSRPAASNTVTALAIRLVSAESLASHVISPTQIVSVRLGALEDVG